MGDVRLIPFYDIDSCVVKLKGYVEELNNGKTKHQLVHLICHVCIGDRALLFHAQICRYCQLVDLVVAMRSTLQKAKCEADSSSLSMDMS